MRISISMAGGALAATVALTIAAETGGREAQAAALPSFLDERSFAELAAAHRALTERATDHAAPLALVADEPAAGDVRRRAEQLTQGFQGPGGSAPAPAGDSGESFEAAALRAAEELAREQEGKGPDRPAADPPDATPEAVPETPKATTPAAAKTPAKERAPAPARAAALPSSNGASGGADTQSTPKISPPAAQAAKPTPKTEKAAAAKLGAPPKAPPQQAALEPPSTLGAKEQPSGFFAKWKAREMPKGLGPFGWE